MQMVPTRTRAAFSVHRQEYQTIFKDCGSISKRKQTNQKKWKWVNVGSKYRKKRKKNDSKETLVKHRKCHFCLYAKLKTTTAAATGPSKTERHIERYESRDGLYTEKPAWVSVQCTNNYPKDKLNKVSLLRQLSSMLLVVEFTTRVTYSVGYTSILYSGTRLVLNTIRRVVNIIWRNSALVISPQKSLILTHTLPLQTREYKTSVLMTNSTNNTHHQNFWESNQM